MRAKARAGRSRTRVPTRRRQAWVYDGGSWWAGMVRSTCAATSDTLEVRVARTAAADLGADEFAVDFSEDLEVSVAVVALVLLGVFSGDSEDVDDSAAAPPVEAVSSLGWNFKFRPITLDALSTRSDPLDLWLNDGKWLASRAHTTWSFCTKATSAVASKLEAGD